MMTACKVVLAGLLLTLAACERQAPPATETVPAPSAPPWAGAAAPDAATVPVPPSTIPSAAPTEVPERFRGEWNSALADCGTGMNDSRLVIAARKGRFYESEGPIVRVAQPAPDELTFTVALSGEGEGPTDVEHRFRLSATGDTLMTLGDGAALVRRRCP